MNITQNRNIQIDALKGFAISLVVLGHSLQISLPNYNENIFYRIISSSNMFLFMFTCGFTAYHYSLKKQNFSFIHKKFSSLVIPFIVWAVFSSILKFENPVKYLLKVMIHPSKGLWFLWILFLIYILLFFILKLNDSKQIYAIILSCITIQFIPLEYLRLYLPFFFIGYLFCKYEDYITQKINNSFTLIISLILFIFLIHYWYNNSDPSFMVNMNNLFSFISKKLFRYTLAFTGIIISYNIINKIKYMNILGYLGRHTLEIYSIHWHICFLYAFNIPNTFNNILFNNIFSIFLSLVLILVSLGVSMVLGRNEIINKLLFGK